MAARNKDVPVLRFKEFDGKWQTQKLSELLEFKNGINAGKEQYGRGFKFINVLDILNNDYITYDSIIGSVDVDENMFNKYSVNYGDILFQRSSETREEVGTASVYLDKRPATFGGFVIRGKKIGEYEPMFLNKLLKTDLSRNEITSKSGGSTRYNVGQETLSSVTLPFPSLPEQQKIASFLSAVDQKIQLLTRKKELLEQYKKGVMQRLFLSELGFVGLEDDRMDDGGSNPGSLSSRKSKLRPLRFKDENGKAYPKWEEKTLFDISENVSYGMNAAAVDYDGSHKYIRITDIDIDSGKFKPSPLTSPKGPIDERFKLKENDIVFARTGASVGKAYLYNSKDGNLYYAGFLIKFSIINANSYFIYSLTLRRSYNKWVHIYSMRSGQPGLNAEEYKAFKIQLPSLPEQQKIASFLSAIDAKIESIVTQITQTQTFKKGLLQQMFV